MAIRYLYIDDESSRTVEGIKNNLSISPQELIVEHERAMGWNEQIEFVRKNTNDWGGLLLDLNLEFPKSESESDKIFYDAGALAQEIRTMAKKGEIKDVPILLCSTDENIKKLFDITSQDLFDEKFNKLDFSPDKIPSFIAHAEAYSILCEQEVGVDEVLKSIGLDILNEVQLHYKDLLTIHEKASFLLNQVIIPTGLLVDETLLAIRLGVDIDKSADWEKLKENLMSFKYVGIYSAVYQRYWMRFILKWWKENFPNNTIQNTSAFERVQLLKSKFNLENLEVLEIPKYHRYNTLWFKCGISGTALESADGLICLNTPKYRWQEQQYIAVNYIWNSTLNQQKEIRDSLAYTELNKFEAIIKSRSN